MVGDIYNSKEQNRRNRGHAVYALTFNRYRHVFAI